MDSNMSVTAQIFQVTMLKAAQLQERLALKLIESATQGLDTAQSPPAPVAADVLDENASGQTVDVRV